jgi:hypothetical protein
MSWIDPPGIIFYAREVIKDTAAATALGIAGDSSYHYPEAGLKTSTLPFVVLSDQSFEAERHAPGESYARGSVGVTIYLDPAVRSVGFAEQAGADLCRQLSEVTGDALFITKVTRSLCSRIRRSKAAATADGSARSYFTMALSIEWEG